MSQEKAMKYIKGNPFWLLLPLSTYFMSTLCHSPPQSMTYSIILLLLLCRTCPSVTNSKVVLNMDQRVVKWETRRITHMLQIIILCLSSRAPYTLWSSPLYLPTHPHITSPQNNKCPLTFATRIRSPIILLLLQLPITCAWLLS